MQSVADRPTGRFLGGPRNERAPKIHTQKFITTWQNKGTLKIASFTQMLYYCFSKSSASRCFFFNFVEMQLIFTLLSTL